MQTLKANVYITQRDNDKYFNQKLPTWRNGFCEITRNVSIEQDPNNVYEAGEYGFITVKGCKISVVRGSLDAIFEIQY